MASVEYAAGLIDGEGYIGIQKTGESFHVRLKVSMTDKGLPALQTLRQVLGGKVSPDKAVTSANRETYVWILTGAAAMEAIEKLQPHLTVKALPARIAMEFKALHASLEPSPRRGRFWTPEARARAAMLVSRIQEANRRGPDPADPSLPDGAPLAVYRHGWWWEPEDDLFGPVEFQGRFPTCGRMVAGHVYATDSWEQRTDVSVSSSSPLLPTATSRDYKNVGTREAFERRRMEHPQPLTEIVVHGLG